MWDDDAPTTNSINYGLGFCSVCVHMVDWTMRLREYNTGCLLGK